MIYLLIPAGLIVLITFWGIAKMLRRRKRNLLKQERLSSSFNLSYAVRNHGDGAQGISQNIIIAGLAAPSSKPRRVPE